MTSIPFFVKQREQMGLKPGQTNNPNGRPKNPEAEILRKALTDAQKKHKIHLITHAVEQAYVDNKMCAEILKKILPDKMDLGDTNTVDRIILIRNAGN
jgi:hypothetical protein